MHRKHCRAVRTCLSAEALDILKTLADALLLPGRKRKHPKRSISETTHEPSNEDTTPF